MVNDAQAESAKQIKSILDNIPVKDDAFPLNRNRQVMGIVGHCSKCNSPIYGKAAVTTDEIPEVKRTCGCFPPLHTYENRTT